MLSALDKIRRIRVIDRPSCPNPGPDQDNDGDRKESEFAVHAVARRGSKNEYSLRQAGVRTNKERADIRLIDFHMARHGDESAFLMAAPARWSVKRPL